jgi:succinate dehydrogenase/fumarate reductase cytochrome b subunit
LTGPFELKVFIVLILLAILVNLGSALFYLFQDRGRSPRTARALTLRISISIALLFALLVAAGFGLIRPHGLRPPGYGPLGGNVPPTVPTGGERPR